MPSPIEGLDEVREETALSFFSMRLGFRPSKVWFGVVNGELRIALKKPGEDIYGVGIQLTLRNVLNFDHVFNVLVHQIKRHFGVAQVDVERRLGES